MQLLAGAVGFAEPVADFALEFCKPGNAHVVVVIARGHGENLPEARMLDAARESAAARTRWVELDVRAWP